MGIPEICRIGQHHGGGAYIPERRMVTATGVGHSLSSARHHQGQRLELLRVQLGFLFKLVHQRSGCLVSNNGKKVSLGRYCKGYIWWGLLSAGLVLGIPDTFEDNRTG